MVLANVIVFAVLKILRNFVSIQKLCLLITAEVSKITGIAPFDINFIFIELSEISNSFVKIRLVLEIKNFVTFIKTRFY